MNKKDLLKLGDTITRLRIAKNLKQSELAYEAGISERTLQRMEAGEVVKSDGLLKVIAYLGKLDAMLGAIDTPKLSPYELIKTPDAQSKRRRVRVRTTNRSSTPGKVLWPEDQT